LVSAIQISWSARLAFACWLFGSLFKTLAVLWTQQRWPRVVGHRLPEADRTVGDREFGRDGQPAPRQVEQQFPPGLGALAHPVDEADELLLASGVAPMMTSRHWASSSRRACTWMPSASLGRAHRYNRSTFEEAPDHAHGIFLPRSLSGTLVWGRG
jgi:hypothetical protein